MEEDSHHALPGDFDPLLIGILGCFAGVFMVAAYHYVTSRCNSPNREVEDESQGNNAEPWRRANESNSALLPTYRHAGNCKIDGTCAVCLSEFGDGEMIRVLPECLHSFHAPCIDMWLYSHTSCPLCRANTRLLPLPLPRRYVPSARLSISSTSETRQAHEDISPAPIHVPFLDDDPLPRTQASNTPHDDDERNLPELLAISSSHSDEDSQPVPTSAPSTSVTIPLITSGDPDPLPASPVWHTLHSDPDLPRFTPTPGTNENIPAQVSSTPSQEDDPMSRSNGE